MTTGLVHPDGTFRLAGQTMRVSWGRAGWNAHKQEGDGATPLATLPLRAVLYRADRLARPRAAVPVEPIAPQDGWCEDPGDACYNQAVTLPYSGRAEALWRSDPTYDVVCPLGWNDQPVVRGFGSAIFLHVATSDYAPTEGCLALARGDLLRVLAIGLSEVRFA